MAKGVNKAIIIGRLGQDPETKHFESGTAVTNLNVATSEQWKDKQTGEKQERTEWHRVSMFGKLAEIADSYLKKGSQVYLEGRIQTDKWQDKDGNDRYTTKIIANTMQMLDSRPEPAGGGGSARPSANPDGGQGAGVPPQTTEDFDDDTPF